MNLIHILVVDDDKMNCKVMMRYFRNSERISIHTAHSGDSALDFLSETKVNVDIVVSDQRMPGMTGYDLLSSIETHHPKIIRILTSASSEEISRIQREDQEAKRVHGFMEKPWNYRELEAQFIQQKEAFIA